jgi:hypothetical protein
MMYTIQSRSMSWKLRRSSGEVYWLLPTSTCKVGRQGCQILIPDTTVSRHHANIDVSTENKVVIKDVSKFVQTAVNGRLLTPDERTVVLLDQDVLTFGAYPDTFHLEFDPFVLACLSEGDIERFGNEAVQAGVSLSLQMGSKTRGLIVEDKPEAENHTILKAMCLDIPIIGRSFLTDMMHRHSGCESLPSLEDHRIPVPCQDAKRRSLFRGKTFVVLGRLHPIQEIISLAGGILLEGVDSVMRDLFIVNDANSQPLFDFKLESARIISNQHIIRCVWLGSLSPLDTCIPEDIIPVRKTSSQGQTGWISTQCFTDEKRSPADAPLQEILPNIPNSGPAKRFKKARIANYDKTLIPVSNWSSTSGLRSAGATNIPLATTRDEFDDWANSTNSQ